MLNLNNMIMNGGVMYAFNKLIMLGFAVFISYSAHAEQKNIEFSADAVISMPNKIDRQTKIFVSKNAVRSETEINGQNIIEIVFPDEGRAVQINKIVKSYRERSFENQSSKKSSNPCTQLTNSSCEKLGDETIDDIKTEKWQIISNGQGRKLRTLHWIDVKRKLAIREFFPDGSVAELKKVKNEKINGRKTEKWERIFSRPDGSRSSSYQWYDTGLGIAIREELPGGYVRELKNIKVATQPVKLFNVPEDFVKIEAGMGQSNPGYRTR